MLQVCYNSTFYSNKCESSPSPAKERKQERYRRDKEYRTTVLHEPSTGVSILPHGKEVRHFVFLKVHKAASGTATSVFFRFGISRNLTFALPKYYNIIHLSDSIKEKYIYPSLNLGNQPFDIINSHMLYDRGAIENFVHKDAVYIGIMRDPFQQFKSSVNYMQPEYIFSLSDTSPVHEFLKDPLKHEQANNDGPKYSRVNNRQAIEFGFPDNVILNKSQKAIDEYIRKLDKEFHIILIAEYFDESMILARRMFNWGIKDVLYKMLHVRGWDRKTTLSQPYDRARFQDWASVDYTLYSFFYKRLWQQIKAAGADFFEEVLYFKTIRAEVEDFCNGFPNSTLLYHIPSSTWNKDIVIDSFFCKLFLGEETDFVKIIAKYQYGISLEFVWKKKNK